MPLANSSSAARLPAQDLDRARAFYADKLGLEPADERPGGILYKPAGGGEFALFLSEGSASGDHTQMGFEVEDVEAAVAEMRRRGVEFVSEIVDIEGQYPSKNARGERATWFYDSEGNMLGIGQLQR
jgi:catechol 2,3-dioxygenase-like lactoylglutathione lyase family enzyme